jgi:hypothetical protein
MDIQQKEFEMGQRDQQMQEDSFYYDRGLKEVEQKERAQQLSEATAIISGLAQLDPSSPNYLKEEAALFGNNPFGAADPNVQKVSERFRAANEMYVNSLAAQSEEREGSREKYAEDMQKLMETGVTEEELPQFFDPESPIGTPRFDQRKVAARLGSTTAKAKEEAKTTKVETPKDKIGLDLQQSYGELNSLVLGGQDSAAASAKVAGLRERFKAATGEEAPEIPLQPKSKAEYDRIPAGMSYIGPDGKRRVKK